MTRKLFALNHYEVLQLDAHASQAAIRARYAVLSGQPKGSWPRLLRWLSGQTGDVVDQAFHVLSDPSSRAEYDRYLRSQQPLLPFPPI
ncbi:MAG: hypothetical protein Q7T87_13475 [Polaromonas sp.]|nr:hypothetical protein [Polaromonas sp.]